VQAALRNEQEQAARARGRAATILTGGMGVPMGSPVMPKTLLGS